MLVGFSTASQRGVNGAYNRVGTVWFQCVQYTVKASLLLTGILAVLVANARIVISLLKQQTFLLKLQTILLHYNLFAV